MWATSLVFTVASVRDYYLLTGVCEDWAQGLVPFSLKIWGTVAIAVVALLILMGVIYFKFEKFYKIFFMIVFHEFLWMAFVLWDSFEFSNRITFFIRG